MDINEIRKRMREKKQVRSEDVSLNPARILAESSENWMNLRILPYVDDVSGLFYFSDYTFSPTFRTDTGEVVTVYRIPTERTFTGIPPWECRVSRRVSEIWSQMRSDDLSEGEKAELRQALNNLGARTRHYYFCFAGDPGERDVVSNEIKPVLFFPSLHKIVDAALVEDDEDLAFQESPFGDFTVEDARDAAASGEIDETKFYQIPFKIFRAIKGEFPDYSQSKFILNRRDLMTPEQVKAYANYDFASAKERVIGKEPDSYMLAAYEQIMEQACDYILGNIDEVTWNPEWDKAGIKKYVKSTQIGTERHSEKKAVDEHDTIEQARAGLEDLKKRVNRKKAASQTDIDDEIPF